MRGLSKLSQLVVRLIWGLPACLTLFILRPFIVVRIGRLHSWRLGHFAANTELYLCEQDQRVHGGGDRFFDIFYFSNHKPLCNEFLARQWKRRLYVFPEFLLKPIVNVGQKVSLLKVPVAGETVQHDRDIHGLYSRFPVHLQFTQKELRQGFAILKDLGIPDGAKFICMTVRDAAYLLHHDPGTDYSYHDYRDTDVDDYGLAAMELAREGYYVLRMGKCVSKPFSVESARIIDYANSPLRSDFMDIFLGAHCEFCITQGTGFDAVPVIFRKPVVQVNAVPIGIAYTFIDSIMLFKHHRDIESDRLLTLKEISTRASFLAMSSEDFSRDGIELIDNSPEEIRDAVMEMARRISGSWVESPEDVKLQEGFWRTYPVEAKDNRGVPLHGVVNARYSASFLRKNPSWLH